jgi:hypothetical protein
MQEVSCHGILLPIFSGLVSNADLMARAARNLRERASDTTALQELLGPAPDNFQKPAYNTPQYVLALRCGWISAEDEQADRAAWEQRRRTSLQTCHRYTLYERPRAAPPKDSGAYIPELAARLDDDPNLTDGARRCARKLAEFTYRNNRESRAIDITVTYLMRALGKCRRTVQYYLRLLEREGYIRVDVIRGEATRMCIGLAVHLLRPLFPRHHREKWPQTRAIAGVQKTSLKKSFIRLQEDKYPRIPRQLWALKCMDGVFRALTKTWPLFDTHIPTPA